MSVGPSDGKAAGREKSGLVVQEEIPDIRFDPPRQVTGILADEIRPGQLFVQFDVPIRDLVDEGLRHQGHDIPFPSLEAV